MGCTGGFRFAGSSGKLQPSEISSVFTTAPVDPVAEKIPRNGAAMPPNASHGVPASSAWSDSVACSGVAGVGLLPPSM